MRPLLEQSVREGPPGMDVVDMKGARNRTVAIGQRRSLKLGLKGRDVAGFARNLPPLGLDILKPGVLILLQLSNHPPPSFQNLIHQEIRLKGVKSRLALKQFLGVFRGVYMRNITFSPSGSVSDGLVPTTRRRPTYPAVMHMSFYFLPILKEAREMKRCCRPAFSFLSSVLAFDSTPGSHPRGGRGPGGGGRWWVKRKLSAVLQTWKASWLPPPAHMRASIFSTLARIREHREVFLGFFFFFIFRQTFPRERVQLLTSAEDPT